MDTPRRDFLKTIGLVGAGSALAGAASPARRIIPLSDGDKLNQLLTELEDHYLQPGVTVGVEAKSWMDEQQKRKFDYETSVKIVLDNEATIDLEELAARSKSPQRIRETMGKLPPYDQSNILSFVSAVRGPYTLVAMVGSAAHEKSDKAPTDIDILVLNGTTKAYLPQSNLYDNQNDNIKTLFRSAHGVEVLDIVRRYNPEKARIMEEDIKNKAEGKPGHWYGPQLHAEFFLPKTVPYPATTDFAAYYAFLDRSHDRDDLPNAFSRPIHLLTPTVAQLEAVAYNAQQLKTAIREGKAVILYQGKENKLV